MPSSGGAVLASRWRASPRIWSRPITTNIAVDRFAADRLRTSSADAEQPPVFPSSARRPIADARAREQRFIEDTPTARELRLATIFAFSECVARPGRSQSRGCPAPTGGAGKSGARQLPAASLAEARALVVGERVSERRCRGWW
jgi:hypothetical protein